MNAQCIMLCSGKGGTGKSTVSVLLGASLARLGRKVLLIELDSGLRSVDIIAGVYGRTVYDIEDVLCGRCEGGKAIVPSPLYTGLSVISAPYEGGEVLAAPLGKLVAAMRPYFDFMLHLLPLTRSVLHSLHPTLLPLTSSLPEPPLQILHSKIHWSVLHSVS